MNLTKRWGEKIVSAACWRDGDGQCDGITSEGSECECPCHSRPLPQTTAGVERWHRLGFALGVLGDYYLSLRVVRDDR